jgi:hypothetical protein
LIIGDWKLKNQISLLIAFGLLLAIAAAPARGNEPSLCSPNTLPLELQNRLRRDFAAWRIQEASNLRPRAKGRWGSQKPLECPGIALGRFEGTDKAYAILLVPTDNPDSAYKLLVFTPGANKLAETLRIVERSDKGGASNYFIHQIKIKDFFSSEWIRKLHVKTKDGILFVDAGETEYEADIYFFADGDYRHEPIDE